MKDNLDSRRTGIGAGTITAIIAAVVIAGALFLFGPWDSNSNTATNSAPGNTTGQSSSMPRLTTPVTPIAPLSPNAPATSGTVR